MLYNLKPALLNYSRIPEPKNMTEFILFLIVYVPFLIYAAREGIKYLKKLKLSTHPDPIRETIMWIFFIFGVVPLAATTLLAFGFCIWITLGLPV